MTEIIFNTDVHDFKTKVLEVSNQEAILVDFWADWCAPCHGLAPHLEKVLNEYNGQLKLGKVEVDEGENMKLAGKYKLRGFPTVICFYQEKEIARFTGAKASHWIRDWLDQHLPE